MDITLHGKQVLSQILKALGTLSPETAVHIAKQALHVAKARATEPQRADPRQTSLPINNPDGE